MSAQNYLQWLSSNTSTTWWHDSGDPCELQHALANGAVGVTTNPVLSAQALAGNRELWRDEIRDVLRAEKDPRGKAEGLMRIVVTHAAEQVSHIHRQSSGEQGYVCAQVDPSYAGNRQAMYEQALRLNAWAPNIAIKLPATGAGIDVMERCCAEGITVTVTVSFSAAQLWTMGKRHHELREAKGTGARIGRCFAVMMIGRLDDYLREVFADGKEDVPESEIRQAGLSVVKHAYRLYRENGFEAKLLVAALRGAHHMSGLAGADLVMSIHPTIQKSLVEGDVERTEGIDDAIPPAVLDRLCRTVEFRKAYDPLGLSKNDFLTFGPTQRTLSQFVESGWKALEQFQA
jgi:transaldolase